jgi:hypothetical protein
MGKFGEGGMIINKLIVSLIVAGILLVVHSEIRRRNVHKTCISLLSNATSQDSLTIILQEHRCLDIIKDE